MPIDCKYLIVTCLTATDGDVDTATPTNANTKSATSPLETWLHDIHTGIKRRESIAKERRAHIRALTTVDHAQRKRKTTHLPIRLHDDICDSTTEYIVHQTNCVSRTAGGLARTLFHRYPYADCYAHRQTRSTPGTVNIRGNGTDTRYIVNLHGQIYPGAPRCHRHTQSMDHAAT